MDALHNRTPLMLVSLAAMLLLALLTVYARQVRRRRSAEEQERIDEWREHARGNFPHQFHLPDNSKMWKSRYRMSKKSFSMLVSRLRDHDVFNEGERVLYTVEEQVAMTLSRLGTGCTVHDCVLNFGMSEGTVIAATERVLTAIFECLRGLCT